VVVSRGCIMSNIDRNRKVEITVQDVGGLPCNPIGKSIIFSVTGAVLSAPWELPWPMPWIESACRKLAMNIISVTQSKQTRLQNPEEPDQYIDVYAKSYIDLTVGQVADQTCDRVYYREALVSSDGNQRISYEELKKTTNDLAKALIAVGIERNENVATWMVNCPEAVIAQVGIGKTGGVMVPLNPHERGAFFETMLRQSNAATLIMQTGTKTTENIEILYDLCPELRDAEPGKLNAKKFPMLRNVIVVSTDEYPGTYKWQDLIQFGSSQNDEILLQRQNQLSIEDTAYIIYTSGTTGKAKGVMLSHRNVIENANAMADRMQLTEMDVLCVQTPIFHCFGCIASVLTSLLSGCSMVMMDRFNSETTLALIEREKCTVVSGVPTMFIAFISVLEEKRFNISAIRTGVIAGASCSPKLIREITEILGIKEIIPAYGLTEASPCVTATYGDDSETIKATSVGRPLPGVEVIIVNPETNEIVPDGASGEIRVRGYNIMNGYYLNPEETAAVLDSEGWLHTGDSGCFLPNGYLSIQGRYKDIIIRNGENIAPKEIEDVIEMHPAVAETSVIGVPHYLHGEEVVAFVRTKTQASILEEELRNHCIGRLATHKIPKSFLFMEKFPVSASGKSLKSELRLIATEIVAQAGKQ